MTYRKVAQIDGVDISKLKSLGFLPKITLDEGIKYTTNWYVENIGKSKSK